ncbi:cytochrome P450 4V2-like [Daktulosphaira vitifoliae]|uniref:cytochrome P450 4V2-like n=1 Tax=Daktulosphaira vitifoliae TaxID=58002 RepID=UPI0021AA595D|nr:cytochrome P450 4V2-like [Daktulosphaira vitifoliae]
MSINQKSITIIASNFGNTYVLFLTLVLLIASIKIFKNRRKIILGSKIPSLKGSLLKVFIQGPEHFLPGILKIAKQRNFQTTKGWILDHLYVNVCDPDEIEQILTKQETFKKAREYKSLKDSVFGEGLFVMNNLEQWKTVRKVAFEALKISIFKSFIPIFYEEAIILSKKLLEKRSVESHDCEISVLVSFAVLDIFGRTTLGENFNSQSKSGHIFFKNAEILKKALIHRILNPWFSSSLTFCISPWKKKHDESMRILQNYTDNLILKKKIQMNRNLNRFEEEENSVEAQIHSTLIEVLVKKNFQNKEIRDNCINAMFAGHDTTNTTISCAIFMLAHNQDAQKQVFEELTAIFSSENSDRQPTYEDLNKMEYLERVIKETLRLFPPLPVLGRKVSKEIKLGNYLIPKGTTITVFPYVVHSNPKLYPDPEKFNPDNFLPEVCLKRHPYAFLSFGGGLRVCAGLKYSIINMKTVLSTLIRSYHFSPSDKCPNPENLRTMFSMNLAFVDGCYVKIQTREKYN